MVSGRDLPVGRCVQYSGAGTFQVRAYAGVDRALQRPGSLRVNDYQADYGDGYCPKTFSIVGIMSWWNPEWGFAWPGNQNGTFPLTRDSTAMALDYMASQIRGCYEGWQWELGRSYRPADLWGCAGAWYSGVGTTPAADGYAGRVQATMNEEPWLTADFATMKPPCIPGYGCPGPY